MTSPHPVNRQTSPIPSPTPIADNFPNRSPSATPPPLLSPARQCSLRFPTRSIDHERRLMTPLDGRTTASFSSQGATFFQSPHGWIHTHMVLLTIFFTDSSSPQSNSPLTLRTSLNKSFDIHAPPSTTTSTASRSLRTATNSNVKRNHYSKPSFLKTSRNFCLLRRSNATTGNCKITNTP